MYESKVDIKGGYGESLSAAAVVEYSGPIGELPNEIRSSEKKQSTSAQRDESNNSTITTTSASAGFGAWLNKKRNKATSDAEQLGPGDPPGGGFEFPPGSGQIVHLNFTLGPQIGFKIGELFNLDINVWTFGEVSTKDGFSGEEFSDGKITSEHSINFNFLGFFNRGIGMEHKIGPNGWGKGFNHSDLRWLKTFFSVTTKTDVLGNVVEQKADNTWFEIKPLFFSIEVTKHPK